MRAGCLGAKVESQNVCVFTLKLQRAKIPKYLQNTKIHLRFKMLKYRLYRRQFQRQRRHFQHFSSSRGKLRRKRLKTPEIARNLRTKIWKILKMRKILMNFSILGVFWYFGILGVFCTLILKISKIGSQLMSLRQGHAHLQFRFCQSCVLHYC
jgi:hypothetical protein